MKLGAKGEELIKSFEQLRLSSYLDQRGIATIGWGHTGWYSVGIPVALGQTCTPEQAEAWFQDDVARTSVAVMRCVDVAMTQNQFDACVSFAYNVGITAFAHSTLLADLNHGDQRSAADEFLKWDCAGHEVSYGLERRRLAERGLFLTPTLEA